MYSHKLKGFIFTTNTYSSISLLWMNSLSESPTRTFVLFLKRKYIVVKAFDVSLFALNQAAIFESSKYAKSFRLFRFSEEYSNVVSSAKNIVKIVDALTPEELHKLYLQERNLSPNFVIAVIEKLVLQQSKKVTTKCTEIPSFVCIVFLLQLTLTYQKRTVHMERYLSYLSVK